MSTQLSDDKPAEFPQERFNFLMLVGDVACFVIGAAFIDNATGLPALIGRLGGSVALLGILGSIRQGAYYLPQLFVAHFLQDRVRYKPVLLLVTSFGRLSYFIAATSILLVGKTHPELSLTLFVAAYTLGWLGDGSGSVPWTALVGRTIPARRRGALFAITQTTSGIGKLGVGALISVLLGGVLFRFPVADSLLVLGCAVFLGISWVFLALIREPDGLSPTVADQPATKLSLIPYLATLPGRLRERPDFAKLAMVQILATASVACAPFLWVFVRESTSAGIVAADAGKFLIAQTVGLLLFAPLWGVLSDRFGPKVSLSTLLGVSLLWPLLAVAGKLLGGNVICYYLSYIVLGGVVENWITITNYLLESVPSDDQPTYIGLMNAVSLPALFLPLIAGQCAAMFGTGAALVFGVLLLGWGLFLSFRLPNTRLRLSSL